MAMSHAAITLRDPAPLLERTLDEWGRREALWIFGYGSLLWRREFDTDAEWPAQVHGWHRAFRMRSRVVRRIWLLSSGQRVGSRALMSSS